MTFWRTTPALHLAPPLQRLGKRHFVGVLQVTAHRQAASDSRDPNGERFQQTREVHRRRLTLDVRIRGQDHLFDLPSIQALQKGLGRKLVGTTSLQRRQRPPQYVVPSLEAGSLLDSPQVVGLFHHAQRRSVSSRVGADGALLALRDVIADRTTLDSILQLDNGLGQCHRLLLGGFEEMKGQALGGFGTDAGKADQLADQPDQGSGIAGHGCPTPARGAVPARRSADPSPGSSARETFGAPHWPPPQRGLAAPPTRPGPPPPDHSLPRRLRPDRYRRP